MEKTEREMLRELIESEEGLELIGQGIEATANGDFNYVIFYDGSTTLWTSGTSADCAYVILKPWESNEGDLEDLSDFVQEEQERLLQEIDCDEAMEERF